MLSTRWSRSSVASVTLSVLKPFLVKRVLGVEVLLPSCWG